MAIWNKKDYPSDWFFPTSSWRLTPGGYQELSKLYKPYEIITDISSNDWARLASVFRLEHPFYYVNSNYYCGTIFIFDEDAIFDVKICDDYGVLFDPVYGSDIRKPDL